MPYKLRKAPKRDLYWVVGQDGEHKSKEPLPREQAEAQMKALYASMGRRGAGITIPKGKFIKEHTNLLKVLKKGSPSQLKAEYKDQAKELAKVLRGGRQQLPRRDYFAPPNPTFLTQLSDDDLNALPMNPPLDEQPNNPMGMPPLQILAPPPTGQGRCRRGGGAMPSRALLQQIAKQSYETSPAPKIDNLTLVSATPTLKFYEAPDNTIVVGIRGTNPTDVQDLKADASIAVGQLESSKRFNSDLVALRNFQTRYSPSTYDYYGVGHSLGGAILDAFLTNGFLKNGVSYNPAIQPQNLTKTDIKNERVFAENDPLYALAKPFLARAPEVRKARQKKWWEKLVSAIPYVNKAYDLYSGHQLDNFEGGGSTDFKSQLKAEGMSPASYLKKARSKAKKEGYDPKSLDFATDGVHKLEITSADGKVSRFGRVGYKDLILWSHSESPSVASMHRERFHKSHSKMRGAWKANPYSPNNLALRVLW